MAAADNIQASLFRLQQSLVSCSKSIARDDFQQSQISLSELVAVLDSISEAVASDSGDEESRNNAYAVLSEIHRYVSSPSLDQAVLDALAFELPKAVAKFSGVDQRCMEIIDSVIQLFIEHSSPRDMLSILCEALDSPTERPKASSYYSPILRGLSKVFLSIQRRHFEQLNVAVPLVLNRLKAIALESDDGDTDDDYFYGAISIANSIQAVSLKLEGTLDKRIRALLGLYVLQLMALVSISERDETSSCLSMVLQLSRFFPFCGSSYLGFLTGNDMDVLTGIVLEDNKDGYMSCFSHVKQGAALAVIWGYISDEVAQAAGESLNQVKDELRSNQARRWQAIGMLKHILSFVSLPWELKKYCINFLIEIMDGRTPEVDEHIYCPSYIPSLFAGLQAIQMVIIYALDTALKRTAFCALKKILSDIPSSPRSDILKALISNCDIPSMNAIFLDCVREALRTNIQHDLQVGNKCSKMMESWNPAVLELVELVLRPPKGGPPRLPEQSDAVLSALNLYRFVFITESTGKTNYTGVLSKKNLQRTYSEWLLPLRTLVTGIMSENKENNDQLASDIVCALNPLELVLFRCIELTEEELKHLT